MGGLGSDGAIETADVIIQTDQPSKIASAAKIGRVTRRNVWQNIGLVFGIKVNELILGAGGLAPTWEAVFADVAVVLLAIFNAVRLQRMKLNFAEQVPFVRYLYLSICLNNIILIYLLPHLIKKNELGNNLYPERGG